MRTFILALAIALLMSTTHAEAACQVSPHRFVFGTDIELDVEITGSARCPIAVRLGAKSTARSNRISNSAGERHGAHERGRRRALPA